MPRYFFHLCDGDRRDLVKDFDGVLFVGLREAKQEAIGLGQDIVSHGIHQAAATSSPLPERTGSASPEAPGVIEIEFATGVPDYPARRIGGLPTMELGAQNVVLPLASHRSG